MNELVKNYYKNHGITYYIGLISHLLLTRIFKKAIQGLVIFLRIKCIECGTTDAWFLHIQKRVFFANIKDAKIYGYAPAEIILSFTP